MAEKSYAVRVKNSMCRFVPKNICCQTSLLYGVLLFSGTYGEKEITVRTESDELVSLLERLLSELCSSSCRVEYYGHGYIVLIDEPGMTDAIYRAFGERAELNRSLLLCHECSKNFVKGAFLASGTLNPPASGYHLEITLPKEELKDSVTEILNTVTIAPKVTHRKSKTVLYYRDSGAIEDFLTYTDAASTALELMNQKILRDIRNNINRKNNFDTANINKSVKAAQRQVKAVIKLRESGRLEMLSGELQITATLREDNPELSVSALAQLHEPPLTKSGINHRLAKLIEIADSIR